MIRAEELRIGNYVNSDHGIGQVTTIHKHHKEEFKIGIVVPPLLRYEYVNPNISPILLTPEILTEWCGFEGDEIFVLRNTNFKLIKRIGFYSLYRDYVYADSDYFTDTQFLHQIQNLYYSLTREELEIKIPSLSTSHTS